jgi:hypothetical protein
MLDRERVGCEATRSAAVMDSQSVRTTEAGGPRGYDVVKKTKGRKRHALVDTDGRALLLQVSSADVQDRDGAVALLQKIPPLVPFIERAFADTAYAGERVANARPSSSRLCVSYRIRWASPCCRVVSWSSGSSPGSTTIDGWQRTSRVRSHRPQPSSTPRLLCSWSVGWLVRHEIRVGLST